MDDGLRLMVVLLTLTVAFLAIATGLLLRANGRLRDAIARRRSKHEADFEHYVAELKKRHEQLDGAMNALHKAKRQLEGHHEQTINAAANTCNILSAVEVGIRDAEGGFDDIPF